MAIVKDDAPGEMSFDKEDAAAGMPAELQEMRIGIPMSVAAMALNMALKYHDINTVQDGALYQQYKLEGRNMRNLELAYVFHTAEQIEKHFMDADRRIGKIVMAQALELMAEEDEDEAPINPTSPGEA